MKVTSLNCAATDTGSWTATATTRRALASHYHAIGHFFGQNGDRKRAFQFGYCVPDRIEQILGVGEMGMHKVGNHFRIRVGAENVSGFNQPCAYAFVVFNNSVVDDGKPVVADVRMRIALAGRAVRRPAGVGDAQPPGGLTLFRHLRETGNAAHAAQAVQSVIKYRKAGGIVSAIFEFTQSFE